MKAWFVPSAPRADSAGADSARFGANIEIDTVHRQMPQIRAATDYVFGRLHQTVDRIGAKLLLVMDGDRQAIYAGDTAAPPLMLSQMAEALARRHGIAFTDLHAAFSADWRHQRQTLSSSRRPMRTGTNTGTWWRHAPSPAP